MEALGTKPADYTYAVFHQPNTKFPQKVARHARASHRSRSSPGCWRR